ncbi:MAG: HAMP domain-containing sensor histidine kinase [Lacunisphaera sp.]|nr:HAMP domain-containing sensor histidine kinase [Lacunisphaera sp.]
MSLTTSQQFTALSDHFAARRDNILQAWRKADRADPDQTTGRSLTLGQFLDHIPEMLDAFEYRLRSRPGGADARAADVDKKDEGVKHGLHRWQQGYRLQELINECGHLQLCLYAELSRIAEEHPEIDPATVAEAQRQVMALVNDTISESAGQYERMQQAEAASHVGDLRGALASVNAIEQHRATLLHQVVHDLKGDVLGVSLAATLLEQPAMPETARAESTTYLKQAVSGLNTMLEELMQLARLQAGQETRKITPLDAAALLTELCAAHQPLALEHQLFLGVQGPATLVVEGDGEKIRRLAKNLLGNALKYTPCGGVDVTWGEEKETWWLMVKDTGPGMLSGPGTPLVAGLQEATASAKESDDKTAASQGSASQVLPAPWDADSATTPSRHQPGEGIGLSIVKRLCELLDASIEIASSGETGTTFRVVFPRRYRRPAPPASA